MDTLTHGISNINMTTNTNTGNELQNELKIVDSMIQDMESIHIRPSGEGYSDAAVSRMPIIPLEVVQHFATDYFDDEDFIYQEFVLPECVLEAVQDYQSDIHGGEYSTDPYHKQVTEYLIMKYMDAEVTDENSPIFPILRRIIFLYESTVHYYTIVEENGNNCVDATSIYNFIQEGTNFEQVLYSTATAIENLVQLNPQSDEYQTIHRYSQETIYGLGLIIRQIKLILETYMHHMGITAIADGVDSRHIDRLFRLANNMCVIMLFFFLVHDDALENCTPSEYSGESPNSVSNLADNMEHSMHISSGNWRIGYRNV